jgi:hypothetical protein
MAKKSPWQKFKEGAGTAYSVAVKQPTQQTIKAGADIHSVAVKRPTISTAQAIQQGSFKPITKDLGSYAQQSGQKKLGQKIGIIPKDNAGGGGSDIPVDTNVGTGINAPGLKLFDVGALGKNLGGESISGNEDVAAGKAGIASQFAQLGSLAKMREGAQRQSEQSAIQRRLAASGMGGSGAGMRLAGLAEQQAGRRSAETQLGLAAEQAGQERAAGESAMGRNLSREQMRLGAAESAAERGFRAQQANVLQEQFNAQFEQDKAVTLENQKIAREISRYNQSGLIGQLGQDIFGSFGRNTTMANPLGGVRR